jgi:hypothetical protein
MININRHNYESFFIDYLDGNLNHHEVAELMFFLSENSDLEAELESLREFGLKDKIKKFPSKSKLKKDDGSISGSFIDDECIAKIEGDLNLKELHEFNSKLDNNLELQFNFLKLNKVVLIKDKSVYFPNKESLKRSVKTINLKPYYRYAAVLIPAIIISVFYLIPNNTVNTNNSQYVANNNVVTEQVENNIISDNQGFKIIKKETPSIVAKSINKEKQEVKKQVIDKRYKNIQMSNQNVFIEPVNKFINQTKQFADLTEENIVVKTKDEVVPNTYFNTYDFASNELKSDEIILQKMEQFRTNENKTVKESASIGESIAETFSNISSAFLFNKEKVDDKKVYNLAFNSRNFEIGRKITKKKD